MDVEPGMPELHIFPDKEKMAAHGLETKDVTNTLNTLVGGTTLNGSIQYSKDQHRYPIYLRLLPAQYERHACRGD